MDMPRPISPTTKRRPFATTERAETGAIVTLINQDTHEQDVWLTQGYAYQTGGRNTAVRHAYGFRDQLRDLCKRVENLDGDWRIRTICTPQTIYADIVGRDLDTHGFGANSPESELLGAVGYLHLWEKYESLDMRRVLQKRTANRRFKIRHRR
jgi:hypothetical protein